MKLANSHLVMIGAGKRVGLYLSERFLESGCSISALYRTPSTRLEELKTRYPDSLFLFKFDLNSFETAQQLAESIFQKAGPLSGAVCVASQFYPTPLGSVTPQQWDDLFNTNAKGHFFLLQALFPFLNQPSHILTLTDIFARKPLPQYLPYASAKGALLTMTRNLAKELAPHTRVNSISPGPVLMPETFSPEECERQKKRTLLQRLGSTEDVWEAASFLFSNDYVTGVDLVVDGGASLF